MGKSRQNNNNQKKGGGGGTRCNQALHPNHHYRPPSKNKNKSTSQANGQPQQKQQQQQQQQRSASSVPHAVANSGVPRLQFHGSQKSGGKGGEFYHDHAQSRTVASVLPRSGQREVDRRQQQQHHLLLQDQISAGCHGGSSIQYQISRMHEGFRLAEENAPQPSGFSHLFSPFRGEPKSLWPVGPIEGAAIADPNFPANTSNTAAATAYTSFDLGGATAAHGRGEAPVATSAPGLDRPANPLSAQQQQQPDASGSTLDFPGASAWADVAPSNHCPYGSAGFTDWLKQLMANVYIIIKFNVSMSA